MEKYTILTNKSKEVKGRKLYQIKANVNIDWHGIKAGDLGGFIESPDNLNQEDNSWIDPTSYAMDEAKVYDNAILLNNSGIRDNCTVFNEAVMSNTIGTGNSMIYAESFIVNSTVNDNAEVCGGIIYNVNAFEDCTIYNCASMSSSPIVSIGGSSKVNICHPLKRMNLTIGGNFVATINSLKKLIGNFNIFSDVSMEDFKRNAELYKKFYLNNKNMCSNLVNCSIIGASLNTRVSYTTKKNKDDIHIIDSKFAL